MRVSRFVWVAPVPAALLVVVAACVGDDPPFTRAGAIDAADEREASIDARADAGDDAGGDAADGGTAVLDVGVGWEFACAVLADTTVACWGANTLGQTGHLAEGDALCSGVPCRTPTRVPGLTDITRVAAGFASACAVAKTGKVFCWGANEGDVLGHPSATDPDCGEGKKCNPVPTPVIGIDDAVDVVVARSAVCASTAKGTVTCWGSNASGSLGRGTHSNGSFPPGPVAGFDGGGVIDIAADTHGATAHVCAIAADRTVSCWGRNVTGEVGTKASLSPNCNAGKEPCEAIPKLVRTDAGTPIGPVQWLAATDGSTCASGPSGAAWCWGFTGHAIGGNPKPAVSLTPTETSSVRGLSGLSGSYTHLCGRRVDGSVWCLGENAYGQLGVAPSVTKEACAGPCSGTPIAVSGVVAEKLFVGGTASFALTRDRELFGWGSNASGGLGHLPTPGEDACATPCSPTPTKVVFSP